MANRDDGYGAALEKAAASLRDVPLRGRLRELGVDFTERDGLLEFHAFGDTVQLDPASLELRAGGTIAVTEKILILHYLMHRGAIAPSDEVISFREMPGGLFYYGPFRARSGEMLARKAGGPESLRKGLSRFLWEPYAAGYFGARIRVIGRLSLYLVWWNGDGDSPASAEILFDAAARRIYGAEDATEAAALVCRKIAEAIWAAP